MLRASTIRYPRIAVFARPEALAVACGDVDGGVSVDGLGTDWQISFGQTSPHNWWH
jgi:hypothetical protein